MASLEELRNLTLKQLILNLEQPDDIFKTWLEDVGLLKSKISCPNCQNNMTLSGKLFRCHKRSCRNGNSKPTCSQFSGTQISFSKAKSTSYIYFSQLILFVSFKTGTFFESANLSPKDIFLLSYFWCHQFGTYEDVHFQTGKRT